MSFPCEHGVDESFCGICRKKPRSTDQITTDYMTYALNVRNCDQCGQQINVGDPVAWLSNGAQVHGACIRNAV